MSNFESLLEQTHAIGRELVAPNAASVDAEARFPHEAFEGLKQAGLLSCYVPEALGGHGLDIVQTSQLCEALGRYDGSTAMIFAMHQIQVGCILHHDQGSPWFEAFLRRLVQEQLLLGSATTEAGIGGNLRTSSCAVTAQGERFTLEKNAPVISYAEAADVILVTARRNPEVAQSDQVHVVLFKDQLQLEPTTTWDTLGFRGTCSSGYILRGEGHLDQILPTPYADIHAQTMHPFAHGTWSALWLGIARDAYEKSRGFVRAAARKTPGTLPPGAVRLAELDGLVHSMESGVYYALSRYQAYLDGDLAALPSDLPLVTSFSQLKVRSSELLVDIVTKALLVCGIAGYRNDHRFSLARQLRDAHGAAIMVNNDRIRGQIAPMLLIRKG